MELLTLRGPVIKFWMSLCFLGHIGGKRPSAATFRPKNHSTALNILAVRTICSGNFSSIRNLSLTLALTLRLGFPPKNTSKHLGCRWRLWQNRNTKSNTVWTTKKWKSSARFESLNHLSGQRYARETRLWSEVNVKVTSNAFSMG